MKENWDITNISHFCCVIGFFKNRALGKGTFKDISLSRNVFKELAVVFDRKDISPFILKFPERSKYCKFSKIEISSSGRLRLVYERSK